MCLICLQGDGGEASKGAHREDLSDEAPALSSKVATTHMWPFTF